MRRLERRRQPNQIRSDQTQVKVSGVGTSTRIPPRAFVIFDIFDYLIHFLHHTNMTSKKTLHSCVILEIATEDEKTVHVSFEAITRGRPIHLIARHQRRVRTLRPIGPLSARHTEHRASPAPLRSSHSRPAQRWTGRDHVRWRLACDRGGGRMVVQHFYYYLLWLLGARTAFNQSRALFYLLNCLHYTRSCGQCSVLYVMYSSITYIMQYPLTLRAKGSILSIKFSKIQKGTRWTKQSKSKSKLTLQN